MITFARRLAQPLLGASALITALIVPVANPTVASAAAPPVKISFVLFNPPGNDLPITSVKLNSEYVRITNTTSKPQTLTGWTLRDKQNHVYKFPTFVLKARASVVVKTGRGTANSTTRFFNSANYVWNNSGDTAFLRDARGVLKHSCAWNSGTSKTC